MSSTRLPGKVMMPILEKPVLWHIYNRLKFSKKIDQICISTSTNPLDDTIEEFANENGIKCFRGSEQNVISRHLEAMKNFSATSMVRITGDNPLVDPFVVDDLIELYEKNPDIDLVCNTKNQPILEGFAAEIIPRKTLERLLPISNDPIFYEFFIGMYIFEHEQQFKSLSIDLPPIDNLRLTLDYCEDYELIKKIFSHLYRPGQIFHLDEIINLIKLKPELKMINSKHNSQTSFEKYKQKGKSL